MIKPFRGTNQKKKAMVSLGILLSLIALLEIFNYLQPEQVLVVDDLKVKSHRWRTQKEIAVVAHKETESNKTTQILSVNSRNGSYQQIWEKEGVSHTQWLSPDQILIALEGVDYNQGHLSLLDLRTRTLTPFYLPNHIGWLSYQSARKNFAYIATKEKSLKLALFDYSTRKVTKTFDLGKYLGSYLNILGTRWISSNTVLVLRNSPLDPVTGQTALLVNVETNTITPLPPKHILYNPIFFDENNLITCAPDQGFNHLNLKTSTATAVTNRGNCQNLSYSWIDSNHLVYFHKGKTAENTPVGKIYSVNLKNKRKTKSIHSLDIANPNYYPPELQISPRKKKVSFINPDGHLEIHPF